MIQGKVKEKKKNKNTENRKCFVVNMNGSITYSNLNMCIKLRKFIKNYHSCGMVTCVLSHVWLCNPADCSTPGSSAHGVFLARIWVGHHFLLQGVFPNPGIKPMYFTSPVLAGNPLPLVTFTNVPCGEGITLVNTNYKFWLKYKIQAHEGSTGKWLACRFWKGSYK